MEFHSFPICLLFCMSLCFELCCSQPKAGVVNFVPVEKVKRYRNKKPLVLLFVVIVMYLVWKMLWGGENLLEVESIKEKAGWRGFVGGEFCCWSLLVIGDRNRSTWCSVWNKEPG